MVRQKEIGPKLVNKGISLPKKKEPKGEQGEREKRIVRIRESFEKGGCC